MRICDPIALSFRYALVGVEPAIEQKRENVRAAVLDCDGEETAAVPADGVGQGSRSVEGAEPFEVTLGDRGTEVFITSGFLLLFNLRRLLAALFVLDDRDDLIVASVSGEHPGGGRVTMWIDARTRVRAVLHQEANHFRQTIHDREVNWPMLVAVRYRHIGEFGASLQHLVSSSHIVRCERYRQGGGR